MENRRENDCQPLQTVDVTQDQIHPQKLICLTSSFILSINLALSNLSLSNSSADF